MAGKSPDRQTWKCDWRVSGQFKQLEKEQKDLLKQFARYQAEQEGYLAQKKTMTGIQAYKYFYETFDQLEENRSNQMKLLNPKYQQPFASDTKRMLDEKKKILSWLLKEVPDLREIVNCRSQVIDYRADTLRFYEIHKRLFAITEEMKKLVTQLESSEDSSEKSTLCRELEELMTQHANHDAERVQMSKLGIATKQMIRFADNNNYIREVLRQHQQMADFGNQTSLVATPNASEKDPNETVIDTSKSNPKSHLDNIEVSSIEVSSCSWSKSKDQ